MLQTGLVLEGGGMRGLYTAGALDFFLDQGLHFEYVVSLSAGACNAMSYISRQKGRNLEVSLKYSNDWRYLSFKSLILTGSLFGMDYIFNDITYKLDPIDFDMFYNSPGTFKIGTTDCRTGKPIYFDKSDLDHKLTVMRASTSLPLMAPVVEFRGHDLMDGGISEPIPIYQAMRDGYQKNVVILTRNDDYRKLPVSWWEKLLVKMKYSKYPELINTIKKRHELYNNALDYVDKLEKLGQVVVVRPIKRLKVDRYERDVKKLRELYRQGYEDTANAFDRIKALF